MAPSIFGRKKMPSPSPDSTSPDPVDLFPTPSQRKLTRLNSKSRSPAPVGLGLSRSDSMTNGEYRPPIHHLRNVSSVEDNRFEYSHRQRTAAGVGGGASLTASSLRMIQNMPRSAPRTPVTVEESESEHYFDSRVEQERDTYRSTVCPVFPQFQSMYTDEFSSRDHQTTDERPARARATVSRCPSARNPRALRTRSRAQECTV